MFSAMLLLPCLCTTAWAVEVDDTTGHTTECCPETGQSDDPSERHTDDSCCCDGPTACSDDEPASIAGVDAVMSASQQELDVDGPDFWLSPDLIATLWLVDRLAQGVEHAAPAPIASPLDRPDRSDTYLQHSILLI